MDVASSVVYFYPRLIPLHNTSNEETGVPDQIRCTIEKVRDDGVYLLENGIHVLLFVGLATDPAWIQVRLERILMTILTMILFRMCLVLPQQLR
jgi:protein transport protein SEC24